MAAIGRFILIVVAVLVGLVAAGATFFGVASATDVPLLFTFAGLAALALVTLGGVALATLGLSQARRASLRLGITTTAIFAVALAGAFAFAQPMTDPYRGAPPVPEARFWELPTGSRLAYVRIAAMGTPRPTPVIYLHGGPGAPELGGDAGFFGRLTADGYDVYLYDQIGAGLSPRLDNPAGYTVARHVADLEAVRAQIGAARVILIGQSWGSTLAAAYMAAHTERVERVVFSSPGPLWLGSLESGGASVVDRLMPAQRGRVEAVSTRPRAVLVTLLTMVNPRAARAVAGDREMDAYFDAVLSRAAPGVFCDVNTRTTLPTDGTGYYANQVTVRDGRTAADPRPALRDMRTPALVVKGSCDYVAWRYATEYRDTLPDATLAYLPGAGHKAYYDQPEAYFAAVRAFLLDQPPPAPPYTGAEPPPDYTGAR